MGNKKGNVVIASVILAAALCVCTLVMLYGLRKFQNNIISYASAQKADVINRLRDQKNEVKQFTWNREARIRDFVRKEMRAAKLELDNTKK